LTQSWIPGGQQNYVQVAIAPDPGQIFTNNYDWRSPFSYTYTNGNSNISFNYILQQTAWVLATGTLTAKTITVSGGPNRDLKNLGDCTCDVANSGVAEGNPIDAGTGNKYQVETDFVGGAATGLSLTRYYNSAASTGSGFGSNWLSTWHRGLSITGGGNTVAVTRADGRQDVFTYNGAGSPYLADLDVTSVFRVQSSGWQLTTADDTVEFYTSAGLLSTVTTRAGLVTSLTYDGNNNLIRVTGPFGHTLAFNYDGSNRVSRMTVPDGGVYTYAYGANGNLTSVTHPDNSVRQYVYENTGFPNALTGIIDELGNRFATWAYDSQGRAISSQHAGGAELTTLTYNADGTTTVTDARGNSHSYSFVWEFDIAKPQSVTGAPAPSTGGQAFTYDTNGFIASRTDWNYNLTTYTHDARGDETSRTVGAGTPLAQLTTTAWHPTFHLPTQITQPSRTYSFAYDANGNLTSKTISAPGTNSTWSYSYNASGQVLTARDPRGYVTSYAYDAKGDLASITNALGQLTSITSYDADGRPLSMTDPNGLVTTLTYNFRGQITSKTAATWVATYGYDAVGQLTKLTRPDGSFLAFTYDAAHRLVGVADALGRRIAYTLDASSNRIEEQVFGASNGLRLTHSYSYDAVNRLAQSIGAQGQTTHYGYDPEGNLTQFTDPLGNMTNNLFDAINRLIRSTDPRSAVTQFGYDLNNRLTAVTDPRGLVTSYSYNGLDEPTTVVSPDAGNTTKTYDAAGNVLTATEGRGVTTSYLYDALNRVTQAAPAGGNANIYQYDQGVNGIGHLTTMTNATGTTTWSYNVHGQVRGKTQASGSVTLTTLLPHDTAGRIASMTYPSGATLIYSYDSNGRVGGIQYQPAGGGAATPLLSGAIYFPFGPAASWIEGNGASYVRTFDQDGRIAAIAMPANDNVGLTYDLDSRIATIAETGLPTKTFGYNKVGSVNAYASGAITQTYTYDSSGNRVSANLSNGGASTSYAYSYDPHSNRLLGIASSVNEAFGYDGGGNTVVDTLPSVSTTFSYNPRNRLSQSTNGVVTLDYWTNGLGQRVSKVNASTGLSVAAQVSLAYDPPQTYFMYDEAGHLIGQYNNSSGVQQETVWLGDLPIAIIQGGTAYYIAPDHLGAPHQITNGSQAVVWFWDHDPFGNGAPSGGFSYQLRFPGQFSDAATGLYYNGFRDYDPATGRYIESDPIGLAGGVNTYAYVGGSPISRTDKSGTDFFDSGPDPFSIAPGPQDYGACLGGMIIGSFSNHVPYNDTFDLQPINKETCGNLAFRLKSLLPKAQAPPSPMTPILACAVPDEKLPPDYVPPTFSPVYPYIQYFSLPVPQQSTRSDMPIPALDN
jgi:RHS repeat-associated protein